MMINKKPKKPAGFFCKVSGKGVAELQGEENLNSFWFQVALQLQQMLSIFGSELNVYNITMQELVWWAQTPTK